MTLKEMVDMPLLSTVLETEASIIKRVPGGWVYLAVSTTALAAVFVPEPCDRDEARADFDAAMDRALAKAGEQLGERLEAHSEAIEKRILAYDAHLQAVLASIGHSMPDKKEPVQ